MCGLQNRVSAIIYFERGRLIECRPAVVAFERYGCERTANVHVRNGLCGCLQPVNRFRNMVS